MPEAKLLILSDLHAHDSRFPVPLGPDAPPSSPGKPSWLDYSDPDQMDKDPIRTWKQLVADASLRADCLVVPGDICEKANGAALNQAWADLEEVRQNTGALATIATVGNHDLDSRYRANTYDPTEALKALNPLFPLVDSRAHAEFWGYQITQLVVADVRFVVVNSCGFHGGAPGEIDHGRISADALRRLQIIVGQPTTASKNVLLCHHHPHPIPGRQFGQDDRMLDGESLLDALDGSSLDWLVIHGHRHLAQLVYASGSAASPAVLAAGSMSVRLDPTVSTTIRNQAHLVTLLDSPNPIGLRGTVESWDYNPGVGWEVAGGGGGLPRLCGFGYRGSMDELARDLAQAVRLQNGPLPWEDILVACPDIQFITPRDLYRMTMFAQLHGIQLVSTGPSMYEAAPI